MSQQTKRYISIAFIFAALAVVLGAFGSHILKDRITPHYLDVFETANKYHFIHSLGMALTIFILSTSNSEKTINRLFIFFSVGILLFSGSLYILSIAEMIGIPGLKMMGAITPFGGIFFIVAWIYAALKLIQPGSQQ